MNYLNTAKHISVCFIFPDIFFYFFAQLNRTRLFVVTFGSHFRNKMLFDNGIYMHKLTL